MPRFCSLWTILVLYISILCVPQDKAMTAPGMEDNCILSFVIPKDKMKSSCDCDEKVRRQVNAMEIKVNLYSKQVTDLQVQLEKQRQLNSENIALLERQVQAFRTDLGTGFLTERRLSLLEERFEQLNTNKTSKQMAYLNGNDKPLSLVSNVDNSDPAILTHMVESVVQSELSGLLHNYSKKFETYVNEQILLYNQVFNLLREKSPNSVNYNGNSAFSSSKPSSTRVKAISANLALADSFEKVKAKVDDSSDSMAKRISLYMRNLTRKDEHKITGIVKVTEATPRPEPHEMMISEPEDGWTDNNEPFSGENPDRPDLSTPVDSLTAVPNVSSGIASSRISHNSDEDVNSTERGFRENGDKKNSIHRSNSEKNYKIITEMVERLRAEITAMLYSPLAEVVNLMDKQKVHLESKIKHQDENFQHVKQYLTQQTIELESTVRTTNIELQTLSKGFQMSLSELERILPLETQINEIMGNMTESRKYVLDIEEQIKRLRKLERLMGVYHQSLEHYKNESKHEYREVKNSLEKEAFTLKTLHKTAFGDVTALVNSEIHKLNESYLVKVQDIDQQMRSHEETLMRLQTEIENTEKIIKSKPKQSDREFDAIHEAVNLITEKQRDLKKKLDHLELSQTSVNSNISLYARDLSALKTEVKLNHDEWLPLTFDFDSSKTQCFGDQYVRRTTFSKAKLVGVVLCSPTRYKIFLSSTLQGPFLNIGDGSGMGEDHCEFVGAHIESQIKLSPFKPSFEAVQGFARNHWGQEPVIIFLNAIKPSPQWYECGVRIP